MENIKPSETSELNELLSREDLTLEDKEAVVGGNAAKLYKLKG